MATKYSRASDNIISQATLTLPVGAINASYPLANIADSNPAKPAKTTANGSATFRATFGSPVTIDLVSFGPHNLVGATVTLTNNSGLSQAFTIPANAEDGLSFNPFLDISAIAHATRTGTQWNLVITGAPNPIAIGEWVLIQEGGIRTMPVVWGQVQDEIHKSIVLETDYGTKMKYSFAIRQRKYVCEVNDETERANILSLLRDAAGQFKMFLLIPDDSVNDALFVDLNSDDESFKRIQPGYTDITMEFRELQRGLAL